MSSGPKPNKRARRTPKRQEAARFKLDRAASSVEQLAEQGRGLALADRWNAENLQASRYVWLPLEVEDEKLTVRWRDAWDLSVFDE